MLHDVGLPNVPLSEWRAFCNERLPRLIIDRVIDRNEARLPEWFAPLARGLAIASDALLYEAGHRHGVRRPRGWRETSRDYFVREIGWNSLLLVRESDETGLWTIERLGEPRQSEVDEVLVFEFGWTPIFTQSSQSAMRLAMYCHENEPPSGLRWIKMGPENCQGAIEFARNRRINEIH
jgi:hypothetical protein